MRSLVKSLVLLLVLVLAAGNSSATPLLRFGFLTDTHLDATASNGSRVRGALQIFREQNVDLVLHGGDLCDAHTPSGYTAYKAIFDEIFGTTSAPRALYAVGNHDSEAGLGSLTPLQAAEEMLTLLQAENTISDAVTINGYTFLVMPFQRGDAVAGFPTWSDYETAVANACAAANGKPVFLLEHEPPQDTVYNSHNWGYQKSREILNRYPQVVELSGHVHGSLRNDLFLWQGEFTVINACCLQYWNGLLNGQPANSDCKDSYGVLTVDVEEDKLTIYRWDVLDGSEIDPDHRWVVPLPFNAATAPYNRAALTAAEAANPPRFPADAALTVTAPGDTFSGLNLTFPEIPEAMSYLIRLDAVRQDGSTSNLVTREIFSEFWREPSARTGTAVFNHQDATIFASADSCRFTVEPVGPYGAHGPALTCSVPPPGNYFGEQPTAFVDYVSSTAIQFLDTQVIGRSGTKVELDIRFTEIGADLAVLNARRDDGNTRFFPFHCAWSKPCIGYGSFIHADDNITLTPYTRYLITSDLRAGAQTLDLDHTRIYAAADPQVIDTKANLYLFANNYATQSAAVNASKFSCYGLKIWQTETTDPADTDYRLVRDFVPCMKNNRGALYDRVSRRIFMGVPLQKDGSVADLSLPDTWATTVAGKPDYFVHYLKSNGKQILETGVPARTGVKAQVDAAFTGSYDSEQTLLGVATTTEKSLYLVHFVPQNRAWMAHGTLRSYLTNSISQAECRWEADTRYVTVIDCTDPSAITFSRNGVTECTLSAPGDVDTDTTLTLFGVKRFGWPHYLATARFYGARLWLDGELVRDFHPCVRDGRVGLYDSVRNETVFPMGEFSLQDVGPTMDPAAEIPFARVDYIDSNGQQFVNLGVPARSGTKAEVDVEYLAGTANDCCLLGARKNADNTRFFLFHRANASYAFGYEVFQYIEPRGNYPEGERHTLLSELHAGRQTVDRDGGTRLFTGSNPNVVDTGLPLYLFAANHPEGGGASFNSKVRLYGLKIWQTATTAASDTDYTLVRDLVPISYQGQGALYDRVTGNVYMGQTQISGARSQLNLPPLSNTVPGKPDYFVDYIESDGHQIIDTGIAATTGVKAESVFSWRESTCEQCYLGTFSTVRMYLVHKVGTRAWAAYGDTVGKHYLTNSVTGVEATFTPGAREHIVVDFGAAAQSIVLNGTNVYSEAITDTVDGGGTLTLFAVRNPWNTSWFPATARCYGLTLWQNGNVVRELRPCVKDGCGGLYDSVNDEILLPSGEGAPITGTLIGPLVNQRNAKPDKKIDYIESDGSVWMDTGIIGRSGTRVELTFTGTWRTPSADAVLQQDMGLIGARTWPYGASRIFPAHVYQGDFCIGYGDFIRVVDETAPDGFFSVTTNERHTVTVELDSSNQTVTYDGVRIHAGALPGVVDTGLPLYLFAENLGGQPSNNSSFRCHGLKIWQNGTLVGNFQPILTREGEALFWDTVSQKCVGGSKRFTIHGDVIGTFASGTNLILR